MSKKLSPHCIDLIRDALLKSFWRRNVFVTFLRRMGIAERQLATFDQSDTKRTYLDRLLPIVEAHTKGPDLLQQMAEALAEQTTFPDLENWEDSAKKIADAKEAVEKLRKYMGKRSEEEEKELRASDQRRAGLESQRHNQRSRADLDKLRQTLETLIPDVGTQKGGYVFQDWFYDLMDHFEIINRRPYAADGRQIDGSVTIDGTTYLVELKFKKEQVPVTDIDSLKAKIEEKADNTMGIMVSISGYSSVAIQKASAGRSPLLLIDHSHLYYVLTASGAFDDMIVRIRRHSAQEGSAYLPVSKFGG
jgi:hypothetical protein